MFSSLVRAAGFVATFLVLNATLSHPGFAAAFVPLGDLPGGEAASWATGVSDDGSVVVGTGTTGAGLQAFRWTSDTAMTALGHLSGDDGSEAADVSADGRVIVGGSSRLGLFYRAFRWTPDGGMVSLGNAPVAFGPNATAVSATGTDIVGQAALVGPFGFRWTSGEGIVVLASVGGEPIDSATGVSADGAVIVGSVSKSGGLHLEAFRQTGGVGELLGLLPGTYDSLATGVSADGNVVIGFSAGELAASQAFRWTTEEGMIGLGYFPEGGFSSIAMAASADGSRIVGRHADFSGYDAFLWTAEGGMERLMDLLVKQGATGLDGWRLAAVEDISGDGRWVVGHGINPAGRTEAFLADLTPVPLPATFWLLSAGLLSLIRPARRLQTDTEH